MSQCTISVKGKDKDKFDFLSKKFGQRAALQSLLEADETVSVLGFISEVEIGTRINAFAFSIASFALSINSLILGILLFLFRISNFFKTGGEQAI